MPTTDSPPTAPDARVDPTTTALTEDRVVRGALRTFVHVRRYQKFYAAGVVWLVVMAMLPAGSPLRAPLLGPSVESSITPVDDVAAGPDGAAAPSPTQPPAPLAPANDATPPADAAGAGTTGSDAAPADVSAPPPGEADTPSPGGASGGAWRCDLDESLPEPVVGQVAEVLDSVVETVSSAAGQELPVDPVGDLGCTAATASAPVAPTAALADLAGALEALADTMDHLAGTLDDLAAGSVPAGEAHGALADVLDRLRLDIASVGQASGPVADARRDGLVDDRTVVRLLGPSHTALGDATDRADLAGMAAFSSMAGAGLPAGVQPALVPGVPAPDLPDELQPALEAVAPLLAEGCKGVGLVGVVVFLVGGTVEQVPTNEIYPLVEPLFLLCGQVPYPETSSTCGFDDSSPVDEALGDVSGDVPAETPAVFGTLLDQLLAIETAIEALTGQALPASIAAELSEQLDCRTRDLSDDGITSFGDETEWSDAGGGAATSPPDGGDRVLGTELTGELPATGTNQAALLLSVALLGLAGLALRRVRHLAAG